MMMMRMILPNLDQVVDEFVIDDVDVDIFDVVDVVVGSSLLVSFKTKLVLAVAAGAEVVCGNLNTIHNPHFNFSRTRHNLNLKSQQAPAASAIFTN